MTGAENPTFDEIGAPTAPTRDPHAWLDPIIAEQTRIQRKWGITPDMLSAAAEVSEMDEFLMRRRK